MRKTEIENLDMEAVRNVLEAGLPADFTEEDVINAFSDYKHNLEKQRRQDFKNSIDLLDEFTIATHAASKSISNAALMLKKMIDDDDVVMLQQLKDEDAVNVVDLAAIKAKSDLRMTKRQAAKAYLKTVTKSDITTLTKAKDMLWHLKSLLEED